MRLVAGPGPISTTDQKKIPAGRRAAPWRAPGTVLPALTVSVLRSTQSVMARPQGITDEEVLAAARAVFSSKGISATVEEVAERCHVGVATIFRRFPSKQALFAAAVNVANDAEWARFRAQHAEQDPDR